MTKPKELKVGDRVSHKESNIHYKVIGVNMFAIVIANRFSGGRHVKRSDLRKLPDKKV